MATLGPKRPDGAGGQWTEEKVVRRRNPEAGAYDKTGETKTVWKVSRTEPWTRTEENGEFRSGSKVIVAEGSDLSRAYANLERRLRSFRAMRTTNGSLVYDPRTNPAPPDGKWELSWLPDDVRALVDQTGVRPGVLALFSGDLTDAEIAKYAPMGAVDPAVVREVINANIADEFAPDLMRLG